MNIQGDGNRSLPRGSCSVWPAATPGGESYCPRSALHRERFRADELMRCFGLSMFTMRIQLLVQAGQGCKRIRPFADKSGASAKYGSAALPARVLTLARPSKSTNNGEWEAEHSNDHPPIKAREGVIVHNRAGASDDRFSPVTPFHCPNDSTQAEFHG